MKFEIHLFAVANFNLHGPKPATTATTMFDPHEPNGASAQKEGAIADSQHKARFLTFVRSDKRCCHFDRREKSLAPGIIEFPRIIA
ncbi:hypothetical protein AUK22_11260 [bacterium CG2_30_54_10]|nr:MAG: hypothetical protein AUK22_11260 [bacterium CG2_30_54_10]